MEPTCPKRNIVVCLAVLAVLNLGIAVLAAQISVPLLSFDDAVERMNTQMKPVYDARTDQSGYRFQNCGGGSVNCHTRGNLAGL